MLIYFIVNQVGNINVNIFYYKLSQSYTNPIDTYLLPLIQIISHFKNLRESKHRPCLVPKKFCKKFSDSPSHRIFKRMHGVLNIDENKN